MIIGISGKMGCGKSTFAKHLATCMAMVDQVASIRNFGDPVKMEAAEYFGFPVKCCYTEEGKMVQVGVGVAENGRIVPESERCVSSMPYEKSFRSVRELLQWYGTEYRRKQDPDYWVKACAKAIQPDLAMGLNVLIPDLRFPNEVAWIKSLGGKLVRLDPYKGWEPKGPIEHESETLLDHQPPGFWDTKFRPAYGNLRRCAFAAMCSLEIV